MITPGLSDGPASELAALIAKVLDAAVDGATGAGGDRGVRPHVEALCRVARSQGLRIEQLLVLLKDAWRHHTSALAAPHTTARDGLSQVVTLCIDEFYGVDGTTRTRGRDARGTPRHFDGARETGPRFS